MFEYKNTCRGQKVEGRCKQIDASLHCQQLIHVSKTERRRPSLCASQSQRWRCGLCTIQSQRGRHGLCTGQSQRQTCGLCQSVLAKKAGLCTTESQRRRRGLCASQASIMDHIALEQCILQQYQLYLCLFKHFIILGKKQRDYVIRWTFRQITTQ